LYFEAPPPEKSCNHLLEVKDDEFPGVSVEFELNSHVKHLKKFPENKFRSRVSGILRIEPERLIVLRNRCMDNDKKFVLQFGVLKRDVIIERKKVFKKIFLVCRLN
uniref:SHSP domain-containing protein n=1 Tax=Enterobius vermicularis TaxID=51028 RepID=A0A0N4VL33_ENTVE